MSKPRLFIGSSKERLPIARVVQEQLEKDVLGIIWDRGVFNLSRSQLGSLLQEIDSCDAALFVLAPDDVAKVRSKEFAVPRDNVIFELGLFMGRLGPKRTFMLAPEDTHDFHIPTDLLGIVLDPYDATAAERDLIHALGPACTRLRRAINDLSAPEPSSTLLNFLEATDFSTVSNISAVAYTGSTTLRTICEHLEREPDQGKTEITLRVALRSRLLSDSQRAQDIKRSLDLLDTLKRNKPWVKPEVRYYGAPALLRSVFIDHKDGSQTAYLSYYDWNRPGSSSRRTTANQRASHQISDATSRKVATVHQSWFSHYWGTNKIHTIIFDFDDTLFITGPARIEAWVGTIREALSNGMDARAFSPELRDCLGGDLSEKMKAVFFEEQDDRRIGARVFLNPEAANLAWVEGYRTKLRAKLTEQMARPMPGLVACLERLTREYQLGIVTGTGEEKIKRVLAQHRILDNFTFIFGRDAPKQKWSAVEVKTQNFLRASTILGIPLDRIVFVGDDDADYTSSVQLNMHFIENRATAIMNDLPRQTLIRADEPHRFITGFEDSEQILVALDEICAAHDWDAINS